jgi:hypothetical protein
LSPLPWLPSDRSYARPSPLNDSDLATMFETEGGDVQFRIN